MPGWPHWWAAPPALAFGFTVIPIVIWNAYGTMYTIPGFRCLFHASLAVLGVGAALLCTSAATLNACGQTLKEWAAQLLLPKAPRQASVSSWSASHRYGSA